MTARRFAFILWAGGILTAIALYAIGYIFNLYGFALAGLGLGIIDLLFTMELRRTQTERNYPK